MMEPIRGGVYMIIILNSCIYVLLSLSLFLAHFTTQSEAIRISKQQIKAFRNLEDIGRLRSGHSMIIKTTNYNKLKQFKHLGMDPVVPFFDDLPNSHSYGLISSPLSLPPFDSLAPTPLPQNTPPFCEFPPSTPLPPTLPTTPIIYSPPSSPFVFPPNFPIQTPPFSIPNPPENSPAIPTPPAEYQPSPPPTAYVPTPPAEYVPSPPISIPNPPENSPAIPTPPAEYVPSPPSTAYVPTPPGYEPSPPTAYVPTPPGYEPSPPTAYVPTPPGYGYVPSPPAGNVPSPTVYFPSPTGYEPSPPMYVPSPTGYMYPTPSSGFIPRRPPVFQPPVVFPPPSGPPSPFKGPLRALWCVAKPSVPDPIIQEAMNYACGSGADCGSIQPEGSCYRPETLFAHASFAFNSYWQRTKAAGGTCDFGGTAILVTVDPSFDGCHFIAT